MFFSREFWRVSACYHYSELHYFLCKNSTWEKRQEGKILIICSFYSEDCKNIHWNQNEHYCKVIALVSKLTVFWECVGIMYQNWTTWRNIYSISQCHGVIIQSMIMKFTSQVYTYPLLHLICINFSKNVLCHLLGNFTCDQGDHSHQIQWIE